MRAPQTKQEAIIWNALRKWSGNGNTFPTPQNLPRQVEKVFYQGLHNDGGYNNTGRWKVWNFLVANGVSPTNASEFVFEFALGKPDGFAAELSPKFLKLQRQRAQFEKNPTAAFKKEKGFAYYDLVEKKYTNTQSQPFAEYGMESIEQASRPKHTLQTSIQDRIRKSKIKRRLKREENESLADWENRVELEFQEELNKEIDVAAADLHEMYPNMPKNKRQRLGKLLVELELNAGTTDDGRPLALDLPKEDFIREAELDDWDNPIIHK